MRSHLIESTQLFFYRILAIRETGVILATVAMALVFSAASPFFFTFGFWSVILSFASRIGLIAAGMTLLMTSREFDLSVGSLFALAPVLAFVMARAGVDIWLATAVALGVSLLCGLINGLIVTRVGVNSFIATLGTMFVYRTVALVASVGGAVSPPPDPTFTFIMGAGEIFFPGASTAIIWWLGVSALCYILLNKTVHGNWTMAAGGNETAARAVGVDTKKVKTLNFMLTSFLAGLCGIIFATVRKTIYAVYGVGMELEVIGATIIGGTSLLGGYGTVIGTIFGATLLAMVYLGIVTVVPTASIPGFSPAYLYEGAVGTLIIVTTVLNIKLGGLRERFRR